MKTLGQAIKESRKEKQESLLASATALEISPSYLHDLERDIKTNPTFHTLHALILYFGIEYNDLVPVIGGDKNEHQRSAGTDTATCRQTEG